MADVTVATGQVGAHDKTLVASTVYTVAFADDLDAVEVISDGAAAVAVTVDAAAPSTATDQAAWHLPAGGACSRVIPAHRGGPTTVNLISSGTPVVSVARAVL